MIQPLRACRRADSYDVKLFVLNLGVIFEGQSVDWSIRLLVYQLVPFW